MTIREILARRETLRQEARSIHAAHPDGLPAEQEARWQAIEAEAATLAASERRQAMIDEMDRRATGQPLGGTSTGDARLDRALDGYRLVRALGGAAGLRSDDGLEREIGQEIARRSGIASEGLRVPLPVLVRDPAETRAITSTGTGGNLIGTELRQPIEPLMAASFVAAAGATVISGLNGRVAFPRIMGDAGTTWIDGDGQDVPLSDPAVEQVGMQPRTVGSRTELSRNLLVQDSLDVERMVRRSQARQLAAAIDRAAITGDGTGNAPRGIMATPGVGSVSLGTNGGAITPDAVADLVGAVADANADTSTAGFLTNTKVQRAIAKLKDTTGRPLGEAVVLQGKPVLYTNSVPSTLTKGTGSGLSAMIYAGAFSEMAVGIWENGLSVLVNPYGEAYARGGVQVRTLASVDIALLHPAAFAVLRDVVA